MKNNNTARYRKFEQNLLYSLRVSSITARHIKVNASTCLTLFVQELYEYFELFRSLFSFLLTLPLFLQRIRAGSVILPLRILLRVLTWSDLKIAPRSYILGCLLKTFVRVTSRYRTYLHFYFCILVLCVLLCVSQDRSFTEITLSIFKISSKRLLLTDVVSRLFDPLVTLQNRDKFVV